MKTAVKTANWVTGVSMVVALAHGGLAQAETLPTQMEPVSDLPTQVDAIAETVTEHSANLTPACVAPPTYMGDSMMPICGEGETDPMAQITSISEFSDIFPEHWAYKSLKELIERYGALSGFPDGTFKGDRPITRAEFAAAMNQLITNLEAFAESGRLTPAQEDLLTLKRLQTAYEGIAKDLSERLSKLEATVFSMENRQFSTTTKLSGQTVFALVDGNKSPMRLVSRVRLNFNTAFSPTDRLTTQLEAGNNENDAVSAAHNRDRNNLLGTTGLLADGGALDYTEYPRDLRLSKLYYTFQPRENLQVSVGPKLSPRDFLDKNSVANDSGLNFSSSFFANNPLTIQNQIDRPAGAGVAVEWQPSPSLPLTIRGVYVAADADRPNRADTKGGLFGDRHQATIEAEYDVRKDITVRGQLTAAKVNGVEILAAGLNGEWAFNEQLGFFGRVGIGSYEGRNPILQERLDLNPVTWAIGATLQDLVFPGTTAGFAVGQPFISSKLGTSTQTNAELFYRVLLNDNISFTPSIIYVRHPNNDRSNGSILEWLVRMVYTF